ncbi:SH3 domain-containing protein [Streptomyces sp. NBC_00440]|uniref:SH3 domain-containing protein n=1 Tax=unclassified Streptomyces TaxID=2593676 RepID=UPI002251B59F|nr:MULTISPECIES: SH3 domain-containing protein [unclassified Streptomyces]MCX4723084.1 SH3 domain-containing protein [Streptomyces sp. NBC_01306]WSX66582.1 SH3 domain-containing protein [Streptomyces sp. NBC_00932]
MFPKPKTSKLVMALTAGVMAVGVAAGPALAGDLSNGTASNGQMTVAAKSFYKGRVISPTGVLVRSGPSQRFRVVGSYSHNSIIEIVCKVHGQNVAGNNLWYKTPRGNFVSARYITNIGAIPRFC